MIMNYVITFAIALAAYIAGAVVYHRAEIEDISCVNNGKTQSCAIYQRGERNPIYNFETQLK